MTKLAFLYATFPRPTETFVRRELRHLQKLGAWPSIFSIWQGQKRWNEIQVHSFPLIRLLYLFFWIPYWAWKRPASFKKVLSHLWSVSCPNLQNWNETFLGLAFALIEAKKFQNAQYSRLHAVWATMPASAALAINQLVDIPFSTGAHAYDVFRNGGDWLLPMKIKLATKLRTSSQSTAYRLRLLGAEKKNLEVIHRSLNGVPGRNDFNLVQQNKLNLLSVGRLVEKKGHFLLINILRVLRDQNIPFQINIIGGGKLNREINRQIHLAGLKEEVNLLGHLDEQKTENFYRQHDALLFTGIIAKNGDRDGIPNVIPEAMAHGLLVLASNYAGSSEAFPDGKAGFSLDPYNPYPWVEILGRFFRNPDKFTGIRKSAISSAQSDFSAEVNCQKFKNLFV